MFRPCLRAGLCIWLTCEHSLYVIPIQLRDLGRAHPVKRIACESWCGRLPAATVDRRRPVRTELFRKARLQFAEKRRGILERAVLSKLQLALDRIEQQLRRTRPGPFQLARYLPVSRIKPDRRLE